MNALTLFYSQDITVLNLWENTDHGMQVQSVHCTRLLRNYGDDDVGCYIQEHNVAADNLLTLH